MTTPWKTWMRERLPSTTRTCTLTVSPGRNSGMSSRNESASSASRVFISAVLMFWLSTRAATFVQCRQRSTQPSESVAATPWRSHRRPCRRSAAALYCATSSRNDARRPRPRTRDHLREDVGELLGQELLDAAGDLRHAPPAVGLVLQRLQLSLPAHVDLMDDVPQHEVGLTGVDRLAQQQGHGASQPDRALQCVRLGGQADLL